MNKFLTKLLAVILMATCTLTLFGCTNTDSDGSDSNDDTVDTTYPTLEAGGVYEADADVHGDGSLTIPCTLVVYADGTYYWEFETGGVVLAQVNGTWVNVDNTVTFTEDDNTVWCTMTFTPGTLSAKDVTFVGFGNYTYDIEFTYTKTVADYESNADGNTDTGTLTDVTVADVAGLYEYSMTMHGGLMDYTIALYEDKTYSFSMYYSTWGDNSIYFGTWDTTTSGVLTLTYDKVVSDNGLSVQESTWNTTFSYDEDDNEQLTGSFNSGVMGVHMPMTFNLSEDDLTGTTATEKDLSDYMFEEGTTGQYGYTIGSDYYILDITAEKTFTFGVLNGTSSAGTVTISGQNLVFAYTDTSKGSFTLRVLDGYLIGQPSPATSDCFFEPVVTSAALAGAYEYVVDGIMYELVIDSEGNYTYAYTENYTTNSTLTIIETSTYTILGTNVTFNGFSMQYSDGSLVGKPNDKNGTQFASNVTFVLWEAPDDKSGTYESEIDVYGDGTKVVVATLLIDTFDGDARTGTYTYSITEDDTTTVLSTGTIAFKMGLFYFTDTDSNSTFASLSYSRDGWGTGSRGNIYVLGLTVEEAKLTEVTLNLKK